MYIDLKHFYRVVHQRCGVIIITTIIKITMWGDGNDDADFDDIDHNNNARDDDDIDDVDNDDDDDDDDDTYHDRVGHDFYTSL